jgi:hypothetical protein
MTCNLSVLNHYFDSAPIVVAGLGGSGTRVVAGMLQALGIFLGADLNEARDNMRLAREFSRMRDRLQALGPLTEPNLSSPAQAVADSFVTETLLAFERDMHRDYLAQADHRSGWGWKVPGNHFLISHLATAFPGLHFIHVIRNGLDMAFSSNQNQVRNWGRHYGIDVEGLSPEEAALRFWIAANRHAVAEASRLAVRFHLLNFDDLCRSPERTATTLLTFLGRPVEQLSRITRLVKAPESLDRHQGRDLRFVTEADRIALREFGFPTS